MSEIMEMVGEKLARHTFGSGVSYSHWCPGCDALHMIAVTAPFANGAQWSFDGNFDAPTFSPSVNVGPGSKLQCHYFIRGGAIEFCGDSHHELRGTTVPLPDMPADWR